MRVETVTVTPEMAEHWLGTGAELIQRAQTKRKIGAFASAMQRGQWKVTHQAVAIDPDGVLIDGQHRLMAVVLAGIPVTMSVAYDVPRDTFDVFDTGTARSTASTVRMAGFVDPNVIAAAARMLLTYDQLAGTRRTAHSDIRSNATTIDVLNLLQSPRGEVIAEAMAPARHLADAFNHTGLRSWLTTAISIVDETNPDPQVRELFLDKMISGAMLPEGSPILTFRRWVASDTGYSRMDRSNRSLSAIGAYLKVWNAYLYGKDLRLIRMRPGREVWPVPGRDDDDTLDLDAAAAEAVTDPYPTTVSR